MNKNSDAPRVAVIGTNFGCQAHVRALRAAGFDVLRIPHPSQTTPLVRDCLGLI